ncbi:hypothetical protein IFM89_031907 [Coptis chinensis]|uniref:BRI1 kinase inhibitor 1-like n=1 Tax=Coptis chinensis TaxID=261450 RepID=A0A835ISZ9_9MAGN|nr:hypothetical protein IFM89_031907 [Coptis chinensis]
MDKQDERDDMALEEDLSSTITSPSSSPSREFSFTISLHPSSTGPNITNSFAIDLSPADEIFFHGHLLPLHLISPNKPVSPRLDSFNLLIRDVSQDCKNEDDISASTTTNDIHSNATKGRIKMKYIPSLWFTKWRKGSEVGGRREEKKNRVRLELCQTLKRYLRKIRPKLFYGEKRENHQLRSRSCSFIDNARFKEKQQCLGRRGGLSAPATMQTSPANTEFLTIDSFMTCQTSESSMEELQTAIQAAIAHCKNSSAIENEILGS